ncbi:unnamed protein product [Rotaria magnacalcarata]|uniref:UDENN domain-containing protein n=7 Tax=Rotaria magnacalcarata TaxID=392030 RepID=A0A816BHU4_9BILA|nr:unnamed protein product [Rotaria magnacalcarata]CAF2120319.1 unnamed protein product [Rotaria magnacalcarata]
MQKHYEADEHIVRSGTRIRESVRCLPRGHFQQIREMFDTQSYSMKNLSTIHERREKLKPYPSRVLLKLPATDDEKLQHSTDIDDIVVMRNDRSMEEHYQILRAKCMNPKIQNSSKRDEKSLKCNLSTPIEQQFHIDTPPYTTSLPSQHTSSIDFEKSILTSDQHRRQLAMAAAVNYADSYESSSTSNHLNRMGSTRQYVSNLQRTLAVHAKPVLVKTTCNVIKHNPTIAYDNNNNKLFQSSRSLHSTTSLTSTGYDSNSSPSILSKRNSLVTDRSNDHSLSNDEHQSLKPWALYESGVDTPVTNANSYSSDEVFDNASAISRSHIKLNYSPTSAFQCHPISIIHHTTTPKPSILDSSSISSTSSSVSSKFIVQTTSFPDSANNDRKTQSIDRRETLSLRRKQKLDSTSSTGFPTQQRLSANTPIVVQKSNNDREENPLPTVENPLFHQLPPRKPPRTFQQEQRFNYASKIIDQKVPSSSSSSSSTRDSPTFDLGARSISCMDLTAGVSSALLSSGLLPLDKDHTDSECNSNILFDNTKQLGCDENIYEELKTPIATFDGADVQQFVFDSNKTQTRNGTLRDVNFRTPSKKTKVTNHVTHGKSVMKKGVSEPNLAKTKSSPSTFFSPRGLINRFKRMLPLSSSKQSLNEKSINDIHGANIDSDDSTSISSDNNDDIRTSRLDHVSRVKNVYDSLGTGNRMKSLFTDPYHVTPQRQLSTLYDYVVHILPEQEIGYFANGNGCLSSLNLNVNPQITTATSVRFKYPSDANDESSLKYFCFPDQHDSNNNRDISSFLSPMKSKSEYFRFTLTDMRGIRQHVYCSRFVHKGILNALCIISPYDMIDIYEKILSTATQLFISYKDEDAKLFLKEIYPHRLPSCGDTIHIQTSTVGLFSLKCEYDRRKQLIDSVTLLGLSTDTIIKIFSSILYEQKLIFISNELGTLTRLINTFICLLYPFSWPHTYIPILPALMLDIIQAPTPYIIGILRSCESYLSRNEEFLSQDNSDILIVDIDHDRIRSLNDYLSNQSYRGSAENLNRHFLQFQILPKIFKIELKQEISLLRKNKLNLSMDDCRQRLQNLFMSIFIQSCYNYKDYLNATFDIDLFVQSKQHTIELFLEWFTRTQMFELFIREKLDSNLKNSFAITFDSACEKYRRTLKKQIPQRITVKSVKRKAAIRANKQDNRI